MTSEMSTSPGLVSGLVDFFFLFFKKKKKQLSIQDLNRTTHYFVIDFSAAPDPARSQSAVWRPLHFILLAADLKTTALSASSYLLFAVYCTFQNIHPRPELQQLEWQLRPLESCKDDAAFPKCFVVNVT
jgi:hypothetical protein